MTNLTPTQQKFVDQCAADEDIIKLVKEVEARPATTRNHYGDYGAFLSKLSGGRKLVAQLLGLSFIKAGANAQGVNDALQTFF